MSWMRPLRQSPILFSLSLFVILPALAHGASCCGGGFAAPSLITGDNKAQLTGSYSRSEITDDVDANSLWRRRDEREMSETYKMEGAHIFWDRWQAGASVPVIRRSRAENISSGLGDVAATLGYEYLTDWDYNPWRPKGIGFLQLTAPTGRAASESTSPFLLDARGRGFWALGAGSILTKSVGRWDLFLTGELHRSLSKRVNNSQFQGTLEPGFGQSFGAGLGWNLASWRLGSSLTWTFEDPVKVKGDFDSQGAAQRFATGSLSASYLFERDWAITLAYYDQTLFGDPSNTSLERGGTFSLQKKFDR